MIGVGFHLGRCSRRMARHLTLVSGAGRDVVVALGSPELWRAEHGSHVTGALVEERIYIEWMVTQPLASYQTFKDCGAGKAKLYARILDEVPELHVTTHSRQPSRDSKDSAESRDPPGR